MNKLLKQLHANLAGNQIVVHQIKYAIIGAAAAAPVAVNDRSCNGNRTCTAFA